MKDYEELALKGMEEECYIAEDSESGFLNYDGGRRKIKGNWIEAPADPSCKICGGHQTYGNDCLCIWNEIK